MALSLNLNRKQLGSNGSSKMDIGNRTINTCWDSKLGLEVDNQYLGQRKLQVGIHYCAEFMSQFDPNRMLGSLQP